ncbi:MAG: response regulator [Oscillospiraceae bacterium]|nr:response regulator [Candidatus Limimonas egerieequi]
MKLKESRNLVESLREVFDCVLVVDPISHQIFDFNEAGDLEPSLICYKLWNRNTPCENCAPLTTCKKLVTTVKYETLDNEVYHITSKPITIDDKVFALEIHSKVDVDDVNRREALIHEQERNMEVIRILASEYSSVYYIDLETDELNPYTMNAETESEFGQIFNSGITYSEAFKLYVDRLILDEDKNEMLREGSIPNIKKQLENQKTYITQYRSADGRYSEMRFVKVNDENEKPTAVALGFADRDEEVRSRMRAEEESRRNTNIIEILASEYSSVYYINLETDELNPYTMNAETESEFGQIFNSGITYSQAFKLYVDRLILDDDKKIMLKEGSIESIKKRLENQKTYITQYRSADGRYSEMKFVKVDDEFEKPTAVALGFADRDEEVRARMHAEEESRRNTEIIEILASEYTSVYYIDLETDELNTYTMNEEIESEFGQIFRSGIKYSDAYNMYVDTVVLSDDKNAMLNAGSIANIANELKNKKTFITQYRSADGRYSEMKFVKVGDAYDEPHEVALGFADKDDEIRREIERQAEIDRNNEIIEILASEYTSVYYIDLTTDELTPYSMNEETENQFGVLFKNMTYSDAFRTYVDTIVLSEDKKLMLTAGSIGNIMKELRSKKTFLTTYRSENDGNPHYCEMKFVKVGNDEGTPKAVALGFADKDEELRNRIETETVRKRNTDIIEILASEYTSVYYIDLTTDELDPYTMNEETETEFGTVFRSGIKYSDAFKMYVDTLVYNEDKAMMLKAGSIYNILDELHDKKTFVTTYRSDNEGDPRYCEMKFVKVGEDDNPQAVALGFSVIDDVYRKDLADKQREEFINGLADDYEAVFHVDFELNTIETVRMSDAYLKRNPSLEQKMSYPAYVDAVSANIVTEDKASFIEALSHENVNREFKKEDAFFHNYRIERDGNITYYQLKIIHTGTWETDKNFLIGVHNMDELTRAQVEQEEILEEAREEAESANRAKSTFLFNMSHDIRTPMNAIIGFNNMAIKNIDNREKLLDCLGKVDLSSQHLLSIINDVLDMARIESGKVTIEEERVIITEAATGLSAIVNQSVKDKNITFNVDFSKVQHNCVFADKLRVNRVLMNVANNAVKYTDDGGTITYKIIETESHKPGYASYEFIVEDTGIGMSEEFLEHIFEAFTRESTSTISGIQGTGLGMAITKELVELMKGKIKIDSKLGEGTKVSIHFDFRIADENFVESKSIEDLSSLLIDKYVLLVEDNELNREIAKDILEDMKMVVDTAEDGIFAVEKIVDLTKDESKRRYDFVLMDIQMPKMDGYKATTEIRNIDNKYAKSVPIIAMTANAFAEDKQKAIESGMNDHLAKPINIDDLVSKLVDHLH